MKITFLAATAVLALSGLVTQAQAKTWTTTIVGTIDYGYDGTGVFGIADRDLSGLSFTHSITASVSPADWSDIAIDPSNYFSNLYGQGPAFVDTITIADKRVTITSSATTGGMQVLQNYLSSKSPYFDYASSFQEGYTVSGDLTRTYNNANSYSIPFLPTLNYGQKTTLSNPFNGSTYIYTEFSIAGNQNAYFVASSGESFSISSVPEPETGGMILVGLGLVSYIARRKRIAAIRERDDLPLENFAVITGQSLILANGDLGC